MSEVSKILPILEEELHVEKQAIESGGVKISKQVHEHEEIIDEPLRQEQALVERHSINQRVDQAPSIRREGTTLIIPIVEEVLVVEKQLLLKEELHILIRQTEVRKPQTVKLRSEEAVVEYLEPLEGKE